MGDIEFGGIIMSRKLGLLLFAGVIPIGLVITAMPGVASATTSTPTVTAVFRDQGPTTGGTNVAVAGTGFTSDATVAFGMTAATKVTVESDNLLIAKSPSESVGTVDIIVTTAAGPSMPTPKDTFTFNLNAPVVKRVFPNHGRVAGGTLVLIKGEHFSKTATVDFGTVAAASVTYESNHVLVAKSPAGSAGTVDIIVTTTVGSSTPTSARRVHIRVPDGYYGEHVASGQNDFPQAGSRHRGHNGLRARTRFAPGATVMFGRTPAASVTVNPATSSSPRHRLSPLARWMSSSRRLLGRAPPRPRTPSPSA